MISLLIDSINFKAFISNFSAKIVLRSVFFLLLTLMPFLGISEEPSSTTSPAVETTQPETSPFLVEEEKPAPLPEDHFINEFLNMLGTLALLIAFLIFASWVLKRMLNQRVQQLNVSSNIKVIEKRALSNKVAIYLVEVEGKTFLLGESMQNLSLIASFPNEMKNASEQENI